MPERNVIDLGEEAKRMSVASSNHRPARALMEVRRKAVAEWKTRTQEAITGVFKPRGKLAMEVLVDNVNDVLREIFEAAVAGSAAEEEMSRAQDLGSETGMAAAVLREESARDMLGSSHQATLAAIRDLLVIFGYVGPLDKMEEMPRPAWTGDMTLIGNIGLLSANVHAAVVSRRAAENGMSIWQDVLRSASKLKDVIARFPQSAISNASTGVIDHAEGRVLEGWLGVEVIGELVDGRWGFGKGTEPMHWLQQTTLVEVQKLKQELDEAIASMTGDEALPILQLAARFSEMVKNIDIASSVDIDGDAEISNGHKVREQDSSAYHQLVEQARLALRELHNAWSSITDSSILVYCNIASTENLKVYEPLTCSFRKVFDCLSTLLVIAQEQGNLVESGAIRGYIGLRSPQTIAERQFSIGPESILSAQSRQSRKSDMEIRRQRVRGLDEEFLGQDEERDRAGAMLRLSASGSQTSLPGPGQPAKAKGEISATSSSTSLAYQQTESDSGSTKGNRSSFMKFMRGRSSSETDDGEPAYPLWQSELMAPFRTWDNTRETA